jgi:uncharacterized protein YndB with AHSA1/START domain
MKKLNFSIRIKASPEKVWDVLWNHDTYGKWTAPFCEGSKYTGDIKLGSRIMFLGPEGGGMFSEVDQLTPNEFVAFKHLGVVKDGKEQSSNGETNAWAGAMEDYTLRKEPDGTTELTVNLDTVDEHLEYFNQTFPKALDKVKALSEK